LQCVVVCCSGSQSVNDGDLEISRCAVCCSVCCSVLQCVAVCCSVLKVTWRFYMRDKNKFWYEHVTYRLDIDLCRNRFFYPVGVGGIWGFHACDMTPFPYLCVTYGLNDDVCRNRLHDGLLSPRTCDSANMSTYMHQRPTKETYSLNSLHDGLRHLYIWKETYVSVNRLTYLKRNLQQKYTKEMHQRALPTIVTHPVHWRHAKRDLCTLKETYKRDLH